MVNTERSLERRILRLERWNRFLATAPNGPESQGAAVLYLEGEGVLGLFDANGTVTDRRPVAGADSRDRW